jgi:hypothetical protein
MKTAIELYTSPANPGSLGGLAGFAKNNRSKGLSAIKNSTTYSLHKPVRRKFNRRQTLAHAIDQHWQADLIDVKNIMYQNSHYQYLLTCIDVLSKFAWAVPIKDKTASECARAFKEIFKQGRVPKFIYADLGNEFKGQCRSLFKELGIVQLDTRSVHKAAVVERFNRTLKSKMWHYFTETGEKKYVAVLPSLVESYNNSYHRSIKMRPSQVKKANESTAVRNVYGTINDSIENDYQVRFKFKVGDYVRMALKKSLFTKGYVENWSREIYIVYFLNPSNPPTYKIKSLSNHEFDWNYYSEELQSVSPNEFPYDSFQVLDQHQDKILVSQLNTNEKKTEWIPRIQPKRSVKK